MGVKNLWDILESCKKKLPLHHLQNKRVCVDLSCWMVQLQNINKSYVAATDKFYLISLFHRLKALIAFNCSLIFVTDGSIPSLKLSTYKRRLGSVTEVTSEETNASSLRRNMGSVFSCMIKDAKFLGMALGIPCLDGLEEAEAQCALLNSESLCDGCFTADSDVFLFGARTVYRDICLGEGGYVVCYEMADIEKKLGFGRNSLIALALLLGSDYSPGVRGFGLETACEVVKLIGDGVILQRITSEGLAFARKKEPKKRGQILNGDANKENNPFHKLSINGSEPNPQDKQCLQVINAYLKPKCHSPDSEAVHRVLFQHPFRRNELQQMCAEFFGWASEKTDEYILPKIAERNLRRFINLRKTSSEVGLQLPLYELPVTCPISAIIKSRKVQGRECFEVAWEEMEGLKTSTVPADLVESACPEKIMEFEVRKAEAKKPKRTARSKKSESSAAMSEVNQRLHDLLVDVEAQSNAISSVTLHHPVGPRSAESAVINPYPDVTASKVVKSQQIIGRQIDVIDLSESETEASPEHARKARELRLFIASIKDDAS
ncbi:single-strand DNA endonuclease 1 isoform X2 [Macadamia integrifolia]|uniref:single-strand DNA endonuclease 1 isoform X2 n=1 Tax=Macadamia integrifolia TaxID=60698 RepID=UPI001C4E9151|nr:single-strand DNA endonuclease 1 isoform X2 [Macadamia integrifolia]